MANVFDFDPDKLREESEAAASKKQWMNGLATAADSLANIPSAADIMLKTNPTKVEAGAPLRAMAAAVDDPVQRQGKLFQAYKQSKEAKELQGKEDLVSKQKDPNSTQSKAAKAIASRYGIDVTPEMSAYDIAQLVDTKSLTEADARSRVDMDNKKELARYNSMLNRDELASKLALENKMGGAKKQFDRLPVENQEQIKSLSQKSGNKKAIANQIDSVMSTWDSLSDDQKIVQGRQLLKTLNSTEGADAIGAEEAKRLGGLLEYQVMNVLNPGKVFGRDLEGFATQARSTSKNIRKATDLNQGEIDRLYGREGAPVSIEGLATTPAEKQTGAGPQKTEAATGPKGPFVIQGGYRYDWNPKTGEYE